MRRRSVMVAGALLCEEFLLDVEALFAAEEDALLTLEEAAAASGYSVEHIARLIRQGKLPNAGRWHAPRLRARDLPRKPAAALEPPGPKVYDPDTDARALSDRQRKGASYG
jgi:hypothetical protein